MAFGADPKTGAWDADIAKALFDTNVDNVVRKYAQSTRHDRAAGKEWYHSAQLHAHVIGGGDIERGAGILAALSPQKEWNDNVAGAQHVARTGTHWNKATTANNEKAIRILAGEHPLNVLGGHKVVSFYKNIVNPEDPESVTIDKHAHDIAVGIPYGTRAKDSNDLGLGSKGRYNHFSDAYRTASGHLNIEVPAILQATTWVAHRLGR